MENAAATALLTLVFLGRGALLLLAAVGAGSFWPRVAFLRSRVAGPLAIAVDLSDAEGGEGGEAAASPPAAG